MNSNENTSSSAELKAAHHTAINHLTVENWLEEHKSIVMWIQNILVCDKPALFAAVAALSTIYIYVIRTAEVPAACLFFVHLMCLLLFAAVLPRIPMVPSATTKGLPFTDLLPHLTKVGRFVMARVEKAKTDVHANPTPLLVKTFVGLFVCAAITSVVPIWAILAAVWYPTLIAPMAIANHLPQRAWKLALPYVHKAKDQAANMAKNTKQKAYKAAQTHKPTEIAKAAERRKSVNPAADKEE
ncbi:hypothetical protein J8273_4592 [Carpediemonas membranifera]|uniref:Uncharacterized protein n=1 Tax=Carpediemonas membranifera TaxID=201153 RepID=A0A8J6B6S0_9EUKA|nr:hypothetical protein J8273_4592 [Carpediemonas membranifera]|eukprot:KAG9393992.1 hypothetical protein J8273_4592 [Carpediemonas membranifera]